MKHLTEDELVAFYYEEAGDTAAADAHLAACPGCREELQGIQRVLNMVGSHAPPARGPEYGAQVWQSLAPRLGHRRRFRLSWLAPRRLAVAASLAGLLAAAFFAGRFSSVPPPPAAAVKPEQIRERVLLVALGDHLDRSQVVLVELLNGNAKGEMDISAGQASARDLVGANRLYRQTAAGVGEPAVAAVLEDLERVLLEISHAPSNLTAADVERIRARIESQGILFKIRVLGSQVQRKQDQPVRPEPENMAD